MRLLLGLQAGTEESTPPSPVPSGTPGKCFLLGCRRPALHVKVLGDDSSSWEFSSLSGTGFSLKGCPGKKLNPTFHCAPGFAFPTRIPGQAPRRKDMFWHHPCGFPLPAPSPHQRRHRQEERWCLAFICKLELALPPSRGFGLAILGPSLGTLPAPRKKTTTNKP